jgi:predicted naringenin-chalcone synthase
MERFAAAAGSLAVASASEALQDAEIVPAEITHLVTVTCTGFYAPGFDIELIEQLRLPRDVERIQVGFMGCHAIINGLRTAKAIAESNPSARVLVVSVELCSLHYQYGWDTDAMVANAIFADGSGALVVRADSDQSLDAAESSETSNSRSREHARSRYPSLKATGSCWLPGTQDAMTWRVGNHGYEMTLAASVPSHIAEHLPEFLETWLAKHHLSFADIGGWATHPGGPRVLSAVEEALQLTRDAHTHSRDVLAAHGNMSSATLVFILKKMRDSATQLPWLMLGFGPGLEIELAILA